MFSYCTSELGYSEGGAYRRISAMRLLREVPEYESKLEDGVVSVATLSQIQSFLVQEKRLLGKTYSQGEKLELLGKVEGKSAKQSEQVLAAVSPQSSREEKARALNMEETEIRFTANRELMRKLEHLKNLLGHQPNTQSYAGLIEELSNIAIKKLDPMEKKASKSARSKVSPAVSPENLKEMKSTERSEPSLPVVEVEKRSRYISAERKRRVWNRDSGQCTFVDPKTSRRCDCRHALELEHILPFARGGEATFENLRLLCPAHNRFTAIQAYGLSMMQRFWAV